MLGLADTADHDGAVVQTSIFEDHGAQPNGVYPHWWRWYNWPHWWFRFNGVGRITWEFELDSGKSTDLGYTWHYYWR